MAETQRWRLLAAAGGVLAERGYARTTAAAIADSARVSRSTFYAQFKNLDACLIDAHQVAAKCVLDLASACCQEVDADAIPAASEAILDFVECEPSLARLLGADAAAGVPAIGAARERLASALAGMAPCGVNPTLVGGAVALVSERIDTGDPAQLRELGSQLPQLLEPSTAH